MVGFWHPMHLGLSVHNKMEHYESGDRYAYSYYGESIGSHRWATQGTTTTLSPKLGAHSPQSTCVTNCGHMVPDTMVVCIDSISEHTITLLNHSIVNSV